MKSNKQWFIRGIHHGMPIAMGYFAVAFTLGIAAKKAGLTAIQAAFMSFTNCTSAGEFAALDVIKNNATYFEIAFIQLVINMRYMLMSCALSQKFDERVSFIHRLVVAFGVTDEIFGISIGVDGKLNPYYNYGALFIALPGWTIGTYLGVVTGAVLPMRILSAVSIALYGMFIAVVVPPSKKNKVVAGVVAVSMILSLLLTYIPYVKNISSGMRIIILTVIISVAAAVLHPIKDDSNEEKEADLNEA